MNFADWTGRAVKVAIVDSGIDPTHEKIGPVVGGVSFSLSTTGQLVVDDDWTDRTGHGTACAGLIRQKAPEAALYSIRIFDETLMASGRVLIAAIEWAVENRMDVLNLSLGTTDIADRDELAAICRRAQEANIILVAAEHNEGLESYPAAFPEVIGVTGGKVRGLYSYYYRPGQTIECVARGDEQRLCWTDPRQVLMAATSYAAPHISGLVALIRQAYPQAPLEEVRTVLQTHALKDAETHEDRKVAEPQPTTANLARTQGDETDLSWINKAALYPFNKEMHSLIHGRDLLGFEIVGLADPVGKGLVGQDAGEVLGLDPIGVRIQPRLEAALADADTLILGYVDQLSRIAKKDLLREYIQLALEKGCHIFSFLAVWPKEYGDLYELADEKNLRIAFPIISPQEVQQALQNDPQYSPVDVPVLGIFGTSSQQGKFTLQLALRRRLLAMGYQIGQIGTEHQSELFGMDWSLPIGYAQPMELTVNYYAPLVDYKMRQLCHQKRPDLILIGAQASTIPYHKQEHNIHSLPTLAFLLGAQPDACILVVNNIDPEEYIQDTLDTIRALTKAPTLLLAMSDKEKQIRTAHGRSWVTPRPLNKQEIGAKLCALEDRFALPAMEILSEEGQQRMVDTVLQYFATPKNRS